MQLNTFLPWCSTKVSHYDNSVCRYATDSKEAPLPILPKPAITFMLNPIK